jgi:GT2 family glycosyltransferase
MVEKTRDNGFNSPQPGKWSMNNGTNTHLTVLNGWFKKPATQPALDDCSLIIPTYQRPSDVACLMRTLIRLPDAPAEVVVVDGSPGSETNEILRSWAAQEVLPFMLIYVKSLKGLTRQRNVGIDMSTRELVFFLDDDCIPEPGYFKAIEHVFLEEGKKQLQGATKPLGGVGGSFITPSSSRIPFRWGIRFALKLVDGRNPSRYYASGTSVPRQLIPPFNGIIETDWLVGAAMAFRREVFAKHRFSTFFEGYSYGEDVEMSLRVGSNWRLVWSGDARVTHLMAPSGRPAAFQKGLMEVRNRYFIWRRHVPSPSYRAGLQFWLDHLLVAACDLGGFISRPTQLWRLKHAAGMHAGLWSCVHSPPAYLEPFSRREYQCEMSELR